MMFRLSYHPKGDIEIDVKHDWALGGYDILHIGEVTIFPERHHVEKLAAALNAFLEKQRVPELQPEGDDPSLPQRAVGELVGVAVCDATNHGGAA